MHDLCIFCTLSHVSFVCFIPFVIQPMQLTGLFICLFDFFPLPLTVVWLIVCLYCSVRESNHGEKSNNVFLYCKSCSESGP